MVGISRGGGVAAILDRAKHGLHQHCTRCSTRTSGGVFFHPGFDMYRRADRNFLGSTRLLTSAATTRFSMKLLTKRELR
jgi:hypothetical protein